MARICRCLLAIWMILISPIAHAVSDIGLGSLAQKGRHHELIDVLAPLVAANEEVSSYRLLLLGGAYYEVGKYRQASATADLMEKRIQAGDTSIFFADLSIYPQILRGLVALDQGLLEEAVRQGDLALARLKQNQFFHSSQLIQIGGILGVAHALQGNAALARQYLDRVRSVTQQAPEKFTTMARIQIALKDYAGALLSINDPAADVDPILTMFYDPTFQNLPRYFIRAKSQLETNQIGPAKKGFDALLEHPQITQYGTMYWIVLYDRARIAFDEGDLPLAIDLLRRAIEVIERRRSAIVTEAGRIGFVGDKQAVYSLLVNALVVRGRTAEAFDTVEHAKSRALVDMLASKSDFFVREADPQQLRRSLEQINALEAAAVEKDAPSSADTALKVRGLSTVRQQLHQQAPELASLVSVGSTPLSHIIELLPTDTALVEYYRGSKELLGFVLKSGQIEVFKLEAAGLEGDIQALRGAIEQMQGDAWVQVASRLYSRLWQTLEKSLADSRRILLVAHGVLHYLPFATLRAPDGQLLVDRHSLHFLPSASVLKYLPRRSVAAQAALLALGNPDLGDSRQDLKFAGEEAEAVSKLFADGRVMLRKAASETNLRNSGSAFRRLHIASHGRFRADAPLDSGLYLASDEANDGLLTVGELYSISLPADLVTLSACETGLGKIVNGDDVVGLSRGFLYAGARSIVASLWSVDDHATSDLMQNFYQKLAAADKVEALRQAQLNTRRMYPHPFFWAAFQLMGAAD